MGWWWCGGGGVFFKVNFGSVTFMLQCSRFSKYVTHMSPSLTHHGCSMGWAWIYMAESSIEADGYVSVSVSTLSM